jgi:prolipoprotein diacylglyceryltransferase
MAWQELFQTSIGLFSVFVIVATLVMAYGFARFFSRKMREEEAQLKNKQ